MSLFFCKTCGAKFDAEGTLQEWNDPTYGPCRKFTSNCPADGTPCDEYMPPKQAKGGGPTEGYSPPCAQGKGCRGCELGL